MSFFVSILVYSLAPTSHANLLEERFHVDNKMVRESTKAFEAVKMQTRKQCCKAPNTDPCETVQQKVRATAKVVKDNEAISSEDLLGPGDPQVAFLGENHGGASTEVTQSLIERLHKKNEGPDCYFIETPAGTGKILNQILNKTISDEDAKKGLAADACLYLRHLDRSATCPTGEEAWEKLQDLVLFAKSGAANGLKEIRGIDVLTRSPLPPTEDYIVRNQAMAKNIQSAIQKGECKKIFVQTGVSYVLTDTVKGDILSVPTQLEKEKIRVARLLLANAGGIAISSVWGCDWSEFIPDNQIQIVPDFQKIPHGLDRFKKMTELNGIGPLKEIPSFRTVLIGQKSATTK